MPMHDMDDDMRIGRRRWLRGGLCTAAAGLLPGWGYMGQARARDLWPEPLDGRFMVGEYLKFRRYRDSAGTVHDAGRYLDEAWFQALHLLPINLIYASRFLEGKGWGAQLNADKLRALAKEALPDFPVSLDAEEWDSYRFKPDALLPNGLSIVQNLIEVVRTFKQTNPNTPVGLYSEVPQNTFGFSASMASVYGPLNQKYAKLAAEVDFYSPSLYNYGYSGRVSDDDQLWLRAAEYAMRTCRMLDDIQHTTKPALPYISPAWLDDNKNTRYLSYEQMHFRLESLMKLGASGCILWLSSDAKEPDGQDKLILDPHAGWLKAATEFASHHR
jgi:hypothetical protein